jgi:hypothetical protein
MQLSFTFDKLKTKRLLFNKSAMRTLLYIIAGLLVIAWAIGFFALRAGNLIHFLPVLSIFLILQGFSAEKELRYLRKNPTWKVTESN